MKKVFLIIYTLLAFIFVGQSQEKSGSVKLRLILRPIQTLVVNSTQENIDLIYSETNDYVNGVSSEQKNHLKVNSTGPFTVDVYADSDNIKRTGGDEVISSQSLSVSASAGSTQSLPDAKLNRVNLSTNATNLITSKSGGMGRNFNITYSGAANGGYINDFHDDDSPTVYTTTVTYTIATN